MQTDLAWEIHDKLIDEYFTMRDDLMPKITGLIATLESKILGIKSELSQITNFIDKMKGGFIANGTEEN